MIYLVHGDDLVVSRTLILNQQKKAGIDKRLELNITDITPAELYEKTNSNDLFGGKPFIVLNIAGSDKATQDSFIEILNRMQSDAILIILADKELSATNPFLQTVTKLKGKIILNNKILEGDIFKFIDYLFTKNRSQAYKEYEKLIKKEADPFYIFTMITYGLRNVSNLLFESKSGQKMNPFVKMKTTSQVKLFSRENIKNIYTYFFDLEKKAKTGVIDPDMLVTLSMEKVLNS